MKIFSRLLERLWAAASTRGAVRMLALVSFTESIFFPLPPDLLLIPMALASRERALRLAAICLAASVAGGVVGYFVGMFFMDVAGMPIVRFYGLEEQYHAVQQWYDTYSAWAVTVAGFTPVPYKLCTLTAGAFRIDFATFLAASVFSRGLRFFIIAGLIRVYGEQVRFFLERRFDLVLLVTLILGVLGFVAVRYLG